jgi:hypothetical protein
LAHTSTEMELLEFRKKFETKIRKSWNCLFSLLIFYWYILIIIRYFLGSLSKILLFL